MRRIYTLLLVAVPAVALGALGVVLAWSATARHGTAAALGDPRHFAVRQIASLVIAAAAALIVVKAGVGRLLVAAPVLFVAALVAALAVFVPGIGVRAAGASRWLHVGPVSGSPAPLLIATLVLLLASWGTAAAAGAGDDLPRRPLAIALGFLAVLALVAEPDFSAAAVALLAGLAALAAAGVGGRRLLPAAAALGLLLILVASRFGYVGGRVDGFLSPERDRRGKGYEVLALARARAVAAAAPQGVGLGRGEARRHLSSPDSDYVFAIVTEEMGRGAAAGVVAAWVAIAGGLLLATRDKQDPRLRAAALASGVAVLAPAALHVAVCSGWVPIIGVSMPLLSYDPAATVAAGLELGVVAGVAMINDMVNDPAAV
jgi:cell division protein FtsW (lipid II flippase)